MNIENFKCVRKSSKFLFRFLAAVFIAMVVSLVSKRHTYFKSIARRTIHTVMIILRECQKLQLLFNFPESVTQFFSKNTKLNPFNRKLSACTRVLARNISSFVCSLRVLMVWKILEVLLVLPWLGNQIQVSW